MKKSNGYSDVYDEDLLHRLKRRDHQTQLMVWRAEQDRLRYYARRALRCSSDVEGLVADTLCDFFCCYVDRLRNPQAISAYLRIMLVRRATHQNNSADQHIPLECLQSEVIGDSLDDCGSDRSVWLGWLRACYGLLRDNVKETLKLYYGNNLTYHEIGRLQGKSKQAVGKVILGSLKTLMRCIERKRRKSAHARRQVHGA